MQKKIIERAEALKLRKKGLSYREILTRLKVSKSSLSEWLRDAPLTDGEKKYLKNRKDANISLGRIRAATSLHQKRIDREKIILLEAQKEFALYVHEPLFCAGLSLYWAEGAKRTPMLSFTNSDAEMVALFCAWIERYLRISRTALVARLYIHKPYAHENLEVFWSKSLDIPLTNFKRTIYKPTNLGVKKRPAYKGCLRIHLSEVRHYRKMMFWLSMFVEHYKKA
jgi:transcriptional regulator with XRE-family HTH domain